jgi:long-chain fatty acid transport protein
MLLAAWKRIAGRGTFLLSVALGALVLVGGGEARSAGFFLQEQSAAASGRAFAGDAAAAEDASTIFYNPAGMTELQGRMQGEVGVYMIAPQARLSDQGSTFNVGGGGAQPAGGASSDQGFNPQTSGNLYAAAPVAHDLWIGLGVTVPFGLRDHYALNYFGRYDSTKTELRTVDVAPSAAYAINHWLSLGGGIDIQRADARLENALPNPSGVSPSTDGLFDAKGGDWGLGFNAGILLKPTNKIRLGFSYRSGVDHALKGSSTTEIPGVTNTAQDVTAHFKLPDVASFGAAWEVAPSLTLMGQVDYYGWSRFQEIRLVFADGTQQSIPANYHNTIGVSLGGEWRVASPWTLRAGIELDPTPTPGGNRGTAVPDSNRTWLAFGISYEFSDRLGVDMSYAHDLQGVAQIDRSKDFSSLSTTTTTTATTTNTSNVVGVAMRLRY